MVFDDAFRTLVRTTARTVVVLTWLAASLCAQEESQTAEPPTDSQNGTQLQQESDNPQDDQPVDQHSKWQQLLAADGTETLTSGSDMGAWRGYRREDIAGWEMSDGVLHRTGRGDDIITKNQFESFVLSFEWKVAAGGNSGVMYRVRTGDRKPYMSGIEYQVLDNDGHKDGKVINKSAGSLYALYDTKMEACLPAGQWNTSLIVCQGARIEHWLNGEKVVDCEVGSEDWKARYEKSKFKGWPQFAQSQRGHIAIQDHSDEVWYRNVKIRGIKEE